MILLLLISLLLLLIQFLLAAVSWNVKNSIKRKYSKATSAGLTPETILESNEKRFGKIKIKLVNYLDDIAYSEKNLMFVNVKNFNRNTLYNNFKFFYYFYLAEPDSAYVRRLKLVQNVFFSSQIGFLILGIIFLQLPFNTFLMVSFVVQIFIILYAFFNFFLLKIFLNEVYRKSAKILNLDNVEEARLESLIADSSQEVFEYPFEIIWRIYQFLRP